MAIAGAAEPVGPPVARSSARARSAHGSAPRRSNDLQRVAERGARVGAALGAAQALAVQELGAGGLERLAGLAVELERAGEVRVDLVVGRHQAADALDHRLRPGVVRAVGLAGELVEPRRHLVLAAEPPQDLEQVGRVARDAGLVALGLAERALGGEALVARGLEVAEPELEQPERLVAVDRGRRRALRLAQRDALAARGRGRRRRGPSPASTSASAPSACASSDSWRVSRPSVTDSSAPASAAGQRPRRKSRCERAASG